MCADQCFLQQKSSRYDTSASIAAQADGTSRSSMLTQMAIADVKGAIHITDSQATPATAWVLLPSYLNSRCTSRNHAASACVLAGIGNVLSPHHAHEQDVASYSAYMQNCECSQQRCSTAGNQVAEKAHGEQHHELQSGHDVCCTAKHLHAST